MTSYLLFILVTCNCFFISADWFSSGILKVGVHTCVVLNVPAIVLKDVISVRSVLTSGSTVCDMIDALAPESRSVFNNLGVVEPLGFIISMKTMGAFSARHRA